jgi:3-deoxy-D-manno-octulosonic-acid transferase
VLVIAAEDGRRFLRLGVRPERIEVTGDPAVDSAWERVGVADPRATYLSPFAGHPAPILVAGSTWESDENVLVPALSELAKAAGSLPITAIVAPHEPTDARLARLERDLARAGIPAERLAVTERRGGVSPGTVVLVDRVGVLAHLYTVGSVAYVGGGFHDVGLHSVMEPAAAGLAVLFGPKHHTQRAAQDLIEAGGASVVGDAPALASALGDRGPALGPAREVGAMARAYIERHLGAARRTAEALAPYLAPREVTPRGS